MKIHKIEQCMCCGEKIDLEEKPNYILHCFMEHKKAGFGYLTCSLCCQRILTRVMSKNIRKQRDLLFLNFDKLREKLK